MAKVFVQGLHMLPLQTRRECSKFAGLILLISCVSTYHHASVERNACAGHYSTSDGLNVVFFEVTTNMLLDLSERQPSVLRCVGIRFQQSGLKRE